MRLWLDSEFNGFGGELISMALVADEPILVWGERPVWRMTTCLLLADWGRVAQVGAVDIDAMTGEVVPLTADQIKRIEDRANELASRLALETTSAG